MAQDPTAKRLGWGTATAQAEKRARLEPQSQEEQAKEHERDVQAAKRAKAVEGLIRSPHWWAAEEILDEQFDTILDALTGASDVPSDDVLRMVGGLKATRAIRESFDQRLASGERALQRISRRHLGHIAAVKDERPAQVARQPIV